jgi:hypothetical protein
LREKDILKYIPTARVVENYLYGQIHFDELDDGIDRFTSNREGVVADDPKHRELLDKLRKKVMTVILEDWDKWRIKHREEGDSENETVSRKERKSLELYDAVSEEYALSGDSENKKKVNDWAYGLRDDAKYNFTSYADCFISENLIRKYIQENNIPLSSEAVKEVEDRRRIEVQQKGKGNISIDIRKANNDLGYLSMDYLANLVDKKDPNKEACLSRDAKEYKPVRDALMHTALLADVAKQKLNSVYLNIKGRIKTLLAANDKNGGLKK